MRLKLTSDNWWAILTAVDGDDHDHSGDHGGCLGGCRRVVVVVVVDVVDVVMVVVVVDNAS